MSPERLTAAETDPRRAFLNAAADRRTVSPYRIDPPASPWLLQAGSVIPDALITGIRSDLRGLITAHVTQNVHDSPTGRLAIKALAKGSGCPAAPLVGTPPATKATRKARIEVEARMHRNTGMQPDASAPLVPSSIGWSEAHGACRISDEALAEQEGAVAILLRQIDLGPVNRSPRRKRVILEQAGRLRRPGTAPHLRNGRQQPTMPAVDGCGAACSILPELISIDRMGFRGGP